MDDITRYNKQRWKALVDANALFTRPALNLDVNSARERVDGEGLLGNVDGKEGNAPETHGTRNGTHRDVGKVDMCVLNPAPWNPGWKWGGTGVSIGIRARLRSLNTNLRDQHFSPLPISLMVLFDRHS